MYRTINMHYIMLALFFIARNSSVSSSCFPVYAGCSNSTKEVRRGAKH